MWSIIFVAASMSLCIFGLSDEMVGSNEQEHFFDTPVNAIDRIKITKHEKSFDDVIHLSKVELSTDDPDPTDPLDNFGVFCIANLANTLHLIFDCPDCDETTRKLFRDNSIRDKTGITRLRRWKITNPVEMSGKTLRCYAEEFDPFRSGYHIKMEVKVPMYVKYVGNASLNLQDVVTGEIFAPLIENGQQIVYVLPIETNLRLHCRVFAYPEPTSFSWFHMNKLDSVDTQQNHLVYTTEWNDFTWCQARSKDGRMMAESPRVSLRTASIPHLRGLSFGQYGSSNEQRLERGKSVQLTCAMGAYPKPKVTWFHKDMVGQIRQVQCTSTWSESEIDRLSGISDAVMVNDTCSVTFDEYDQTGSYFCVGCSDLTANKSVCSSKTNEVPNHVLDVNITGPPYARPMPPKATKKGEKFSIEYNTFCSNPKSLQSDIFLTCDNIKYSLLEEKNGIKFAHMVQSPDLSFCQEVAVQFRNDVREKSSCTLHVANRYGQALIQVQGSGTTYDTPISISKSTRSRPIFLIVGLLLFAIAVILCVVGFLWTRRTACFSYRKADNHSDDYAKSDCSSENGKMLHKEQNICGEIKADIVNETENERQKAGKNGYVFVSKQVVV